MTDGVGPGLWHLLGNRLDDDCSRTGTVDPPVGARDSDTEATIARFEPMPEACDRELRGSIDNDPFARSVAKGDDVALRTR